MLSNHQGHSEVLDRILAASSGHDGLGRTEEARTELAAALAADPMLHEVRAALSRIDGEPRPER